MNKENVKDPIILDFSNNAYETLKKLESILCTSGWNKYLLVDPDTPSENKLLLSLVREQAIIVGEVYYTFVYDFIEELRNKAYEYFHRLRKRNMDSIYLNSVNYFSKYEPDIEKTYNGALFYPDINAYVRCGDLLPKKMFELMQKDGCERVIVFGSGLRLDKEQPWEEFHSFEMRAPKKYILEQLAQLEEEQMQAIRRAMEASGINKVFENIIPPVFDCEL